MLMFQMPTASFFAIQMANTAGVDPDGSIVAVAQASETKKL